MTKENHNKEYYSKMVKSIYQENKSIANQNKDNFNISRNPILLSNSNNPNISNSHVNNEP